jgi:hypothetical protein
MDCVNLLIPGDITPLAEAGDDQNLPSASELISSVQSHLREHVVEKLEGADKFLVRVAINSLSIAERELAHQDEVDRAEYARLSSLLTDVSHVNALLSTDIADRTGEADSLSDLRWRLVQALRDDQALDTDMLGEHLRQTVAHRLFIDQPKYSALRD